MTGYPCLGAPAASDPLYRRLLGRFLSCLIAEGVYLSAHPWFLCLSHTDADIDVSLDKARTALKKAMS